MTPNKPRYTALVLLPKDTESAIFQAEGYCMDFLGECPMVPPEDRNLGWAKIAHHMTICMGEIPTKFAHLLGDRVSIEIDGIGISDRVIALRVKKDSIAGRLSVNEIPHITIAVNHGEGAKPFESNAINNWYDISFDNPSDSIILNGIVTEVK
jgi:hypothetical protein|tara:strand:+ start:2100 stop:2558 length:459 start_codon:yes stop_codon:yes gene_type:complete